MNIEEFREYCLSKPGVTEDLPFDETTLVFKAGGKIFALTDLEEEFRINLKCDPERANKLREDYTCVIPGYHMNKKHWNTIKVDGSMEDAMLSDLVDHSYQLVFNSLPKKVKDKIGYGK
jgi:predicted DNA-binding protein (MmcQ/YjbR family)